MPRRGTASLSLSRPCFAAVADRCRGHVAPDCDEPNGCEAPPGQHSDRPYQTAGAESPGGAAAPAALGLASAASTHGARRAFVRHTRCANEGSATIWQNATAASQEPPTLLDDSRDLAYYGVTAASGVTLATIIVDYGADTL